MHRLSKKGEKLLNFLLLPGSNALKSKSTVDFCLGQQGRKIIYDFYVHVPATSHPALPGVLHNLLRVTEW